MTQFLAQFQIALMMLTRLPVGRTAGDMPSIAASAWAFPVVGALVGAASAVAFVAAVVAGLEPLLASLVAIATGAIATGALHEDGLADTADGFGGGQDKARKLDIMKDSRIGTYGVVTLCLVIGMKAVAMSQVAHPGWALIGLAAFSRTQMPVLMWILPHARPDGLSQLAGSTTPAVVFSALGLGLIFMLPLGFSAILVCAGMLAVTGMLAWLAKRQIEGQTGDVLGAGQLLAETFGWLMLAALS